MSFIGSLLIRVWRFYCVILTDDLSLFNAGDPFHGTVIFDASVTSVAVEAINCNGQKAVKMVNYWWWLCDSIFM